MKPLHLLVLGMVASAALALAAEKPSSAQKKARGLEVLITADAISSPEGFRPKPGKPIHYIFNQTRQSLGEAVGGVKLPDAVVIERAIVAELSNQGFVRTVVGGPMPALYILAVVGDANFKEPPDDNEELETYVTPIVARDVLGKQGLGEILRKFGINGIFDEAPTLDPEESERLKARDILRAAAIGIRYRQSPRFRDRGGIQMIVGADKVMRAVEARALNHSEAEKIAWAARDDRLYITLSAFDAARWVRKEKILLWRTSMSIDWRKDFAAELPTMLAQAGPLFGTDVAVPVFLDERDRRKAEVEIGEVRVVPDEPKREEANVPKK